MPQSSTRGPSSRWFLSPRSSPALSLLAYLAGEAVRKRWGMFLTIAESAAVVSIILLLMLFLPRYRRPIVVALLVVLLMLLLVPFLPQFF
jgi:hypothetical protein